MHIAMPDFKIRLLRCGYSKQFCLQFLVHFCFAIIAMQVAMGDLHDGVI